MCNEVNGLSFVFVIYQVINFIDVMKKQTTLLYSLFFIRAKSDCYSSLKEVLIVCGITGLIIKPNALIPVDSSTYNVSLN